jgi:hypothetical protein
LNTVGKEDRVITRISVVLIVLLLVAAPSWGQCAPDRMVKIIYQNATPGLAEDSLETVPRTLYRLGTDFGRLERATRIGVETYGLLITNVPDRWKVDTITNTGMYYYDESAANRFTAPVYPDLAEVEFLRPLEFGCELEFMRQHATEPPVEAEISGRKLRNYTVKNGRYRLNLAVSQKTGLPLALGLFNGKEMIHYMRYVEYRILPFRPSLFYPPPDMEIVVVE